MKTISIILCAMLLFGCAKKIRVYESIDNIQDVARNKPELQELYWFDTGETCKVKLNIANSQIIQMDNKLYTIEKQLDNLKKASK